MFPVVLTSAQIPLFMKTKVQENCDDVNYGVGYALLVCRSGMFAFLGFVIVISVIPTKWFGRQRTRLSLAR